MYSCVHTNSCPRFGPLDLIHVSRARARPLSVEGPEFHIGTIDSIPDRGTVDGTIRQHVIPSHHLCMGGEIVANGSYAFI